MPRRSATKTHRARALRRQMTDAEAKLWWRLRGRQLGGRKFVRQCPIGPYIADFLCRELKLIVEVDGSQHTPERDAARTAFLEQQGYMLIRFSNQQALVETEAVLETLLHAVERRRESLQGPLTLPSPQGGEG